MFGLVLLLIFSSETSLLWGLYAQTPDARTVGLAVFSTLWFVIALVWFFVAMSRGSR